MYHSYMQVPTTHVNNSKYNMWPVLQNLDTKTKYYSSHHIGLDNTLHQLEHLFHNHWHNIIACISPKQTKITKHIIAHGSEARQHLKKTCQISPALLSFYSRPDLCCFFFYHMSTRSRVNSYDVHIIFSRFYKDKKYRKRIVSVTVSPLKRVTYKR